MQDDRVSLLQPNQALEQRLQEGVLLDSRVCQSDTDQAPPVGKLLELFKQPVNIQ